MEYILKGLMLNTGNSSREIKKKKKDKLKKNQFISGRQLRCSLTTLIFHDDYAAPAEEATQ
ncbi:hypothetical protein DICVIV_08039 [Dictyocaulus viviparus]|uniref:Uncharacterized protein n=1 Tax=Dictyocaulus viviparus TaxID=29172 RepID=A0A0D8XU68_DICVI|nr:hypothetical protein DICVIV_08039 [Dictyocaulus viviparus]